MQPTAPELKILKKLWDEHPLSTRDIHDHVSSALGWGYSSTRKTLERMQSKGLVTSQPEGNKLLYSPAVDKVTTLAEFARDFAQRIFELDAPLPVAMFADSRLVSEEDIQQLEKLLNQNEQE